jgi:hypothetical protein
MEDPMPQPSSPPDSPDVLSALPEAWDYVLPSEGDSVPAPVRRVTLEEAENHFRPWIDAFPDSWPTEVERWARKGSAPFVMHDEPPA